MCQRRHCVEGGERSYWRAVSQWVAATRARYQGFRGEDLTQCFMRGPFAGWSEREVSELADRLSENAVKFPLRGHEDLEWGKGGEGEKPEGSGDDAYCPTCQSCGEPGCCSVEQAIAGHGCKYSEHYAQQVYYDKMIIDEFHKLVEDLLRQGGGDGGEVKRLVGELYDRAWQRAEKKYKRT